MNGTINIWDQKNEPQFKKIGIKNHKNIGHKDNISVLIPIKKLQFLASASFDKKIILWDTIDYKKKREYSGYH